MTLRVGQRPRTTGLVCLGRESLTGAARDLWLVTPSLLAYVEIGTVTRFGLGNAQLSSDLALFSRYGHWRCIPTGKEPEIQELIRALATYDRRLNRLTEPARVYKSVRRTPGTGFCLGPFACGLQ
jgi:hypothetical protein